METKLLQLQSQIVRKMVAHEMIDETNYKRATKEISEEVFRQVIRQNSRRTRWEAHVAKFQDATTEEEAMSLKHELKKFVICPIDKHGAEGMIM